MTDGQHEGSAARRRELADLEAAIAALEGQRAVLGDDVVDTPLASLRAQLASLREQDATASEEPRPTTGPTR